MEGELFENTGWDGDQECAIFYGVKLNVPIGPYPVGTQFTSATIVQDENGGVLELYEDDEVCFKCKLHYRLGETIDSTPATDEHGNG